MSAQAVEGDDFIIFMYLIIGVELVEHPGKEQGQISWRLSIDIISMNFEGPTQQLKCPSPSCHAGHGQMYNLRSRSTDTYEQVEHE